MKKVILASCLTLSSVSCFADSITFNSDGTHSMTMEDHQGKDSITFNSDGTHSMTFED